MASDTPKPSERIRAQKSPAEALIEVGAILDELQGRIDAGIQQQSVSGWETWGPVETDGRDYSGGPEPWVPSPDDIAELKTLEEELHGNADADESRVLRAKIELCKDRLQPPTEMYDASGNATETHYDDDGNAIVDLPAPTPEQIDVRAGIVPQLGLRDQYGEELGAQAEESFIRGGPLLLYLSDRDFVNQLPSNVKALLVDDVLQSSPREAHEMARDILKASTDDSNDLEAVKSRIFGDVESGAIHNAP